MLERRANRAVANGPRYDIERYIESLRYADPHETDLLWCQVAEGRRTLEAADPIFQTVLDDPRNFAGRRELSDAWRKLRVLIRRARKADLPLLASAWLPWLHTLRVVNSDEPELLDLGKTMWTLIEPARIQAEEGESCLTPRGFRPDSTDEAPGQPVRTTQRTTRAASAA